MARNKKEQLPLADINDTVTDVNIVELIPNVIDNIMVTMYEGFHTVVLPLNVNNLIFRNWHKGKGGVFSRDVVKYSQGKTPGKYILLQGLTLNCVARIISDEELDTFKSLKLVDGQIKDRPYMILKHLEEGEKLNGSQKYLNEISLAHEEAEVMYANVQHEDDDFESHAGSISLFSE